MSIFCCADVVVDWDFVVAVQRHHPLYITIHLSTGAVLEMKANSEETNNVNFDRLYSYWEKAKQIP